MVRLDEPSGSVKGNFLNFLSQFDTDFSYKSTYKNCNLVYNIGIRIVALRPSVKKHFCMIVRNDRHYLIVISGDVISMLGFSFIFSRSTLVIYMH